MKRTYKKHNRKFWTLKSVNKHSMGVWKFIILIMTSFVLWALLYQYTNRYPLISPIVLNPIEPAYAESISCETPKGYLECQVYNGKITWAEHDKMYKIIQCESKWNPDAINTKNKNGSWDAGLVQINSIHKNISNADKFDFKKSIDWMIAKYKADKSFNAWVCSRYN